MKKLVAVKVGEARSAVESLRQQVAQVQADTHLSDEGRTKRITEAVEQARAGVSVHVESARETVDLVQRKAQARLDELTHVSDEDMTARAAVLAPILQNAASKPDALIRAYERRFDDRAARRVLEDAASSVLDLLEGGPKTRFAEQWERAQSALQERKPAEEREAEQAVKDADELAGYVNAAERVFSFDLAEIEGKRGEAFGVGRTLAAHQVQQFEAQLQETAETA